MLYPVRKVIPYVVLVGLFSLVGALEEEFRIIASVLGPSVLLWHFWELPVIQVIVKIDIEMPC